MDRESWQRAYTCSDCKASIYSPSSGIVSICKCEDDSWIAVCQTPIGEAMWGEEEKFIPVED